MNKNLEHHFIVSYLPGRGWAIEVEMTFHGGSAFPEGTVFDWENDQWTDGSGENSFQSDMAYQKLDLELNLLNERTKAEQNL
jgi:hypothetical protein